MLTINIICVGKLKERYWRDAIEEYSKRMKPLCKLNIVELNEERVGDDPSDAQIRHTITAESERIMQKLGKGDYVIAMCVEGKNISSEELSQRIEETCLTYEAQHGEDDLSASAVPRNAVRTALPRVPDQ